MNLSGVRVQSAFNFAERRQAYGLIVQHDSAVPPHL